MKRRVQVMEGNEAAAHVAFRTNEVIAIYPITPSSGMGELADQWAAAGMKNIWGSTPHVIEMQSEGGAAAALHGSLQAGALSTTFTASQGLLLMIPTMFKLAGELTPTVFHIAARALSAQALSIFGDHSDVMATRQTGFGMLFSNSPQEVMDMALIAQMSSLETRLPFLHAFDGFRTSHEVQKIEVLNDEDIRTLIPMSMVHAHRERAMTPDKPVLRGTAQNPDTYFQGRETVNPYYLAAPELVQQAMDAFHKQVGRQYNLFDYVGAEDAEHVVVAMGSSCDAINETVDHLNSEGGKTGAIKVRLYRPFSVGHFLNALPKTVKSITILDRCKEPGASGEPVYQDAITAIAEGVAAGTAPFDAMPRILGGRYGLSSKEFNPAMVKGVFDNAMSDTPKNHFTVGINDDLTHTSIDYDPDWNIEPADVTRAVFWGLGSDGTVGANKNSIKIIGMETDNYAQGYFVYDSKKSGARTVSHLRFGPRPIQSTYLLDKANFVAVHQFGFVERFDTLEMAEPGATFLVNSPYGPDELWGNLPPRVQKQIVDKKLKVYTIDAYRIAREHRLGARINTVMQVAFFALSSVLETDDAIAKVKDAIKKTYGGRGEVVVKSNWAAVDDTIANLHEMKVPAKAGAATANGGAPEEWPEFVRDVLYPMMIGDGDSLPVSKIPADGTYPTATTQYEKRNIAQEVPLWESDICIQCGKCVMVCPHSVIRSKLMTDDQVQAAPSGFKSAKAKWRNIPDTLFSIQVSFEDCTGCRLCVEVCPAKDKSNVARKAINMVGRSDVGDEEISHWDYFDGLGDSFRTHGGDGKLSFTKPKDIQLADPLFEFSSACAGCGETPYIKAMTQMFGDRALIANATGCSSIYGGNMPTTPYSVDDEGRGPTWNNSLFEDAAEFGLGFRLAVDKQAEFARELVWNLRDLVGESFAKELIRDSANHEQPNEEAINEQRARVAKLKEMLQDNDDPRVRDLMKVADNLVKRSVWIFGGDGWAYDIGFGGLDHVIASGRNVNLFVLDTEVYSNTGGQASKSTPMGAVAKFAAGGSPTPKKDLGAIAMNYGNVYVATVSLGANDGQTLKALQEAESFDGPSLIIAYSHCIAHGIDMTKGLDQQRLAVESGHFPLYRFDPRLEDQGKNPFQLDSKAPKIGIKDYIYNENRYRMLLKSNPETAARLCDGAQKYVNKHWERLQQLAAGTPKES